MQTNVHTCTPSEHCPHMYTFVNPVHSADRCAHVHSACIVNIVRTVHNARICARVNKDARNVDMIVPA